VALRAVSEIEFEEAISSLGLADKCGSVTGDLFDSTCALIQIGGIAVDESPYLSGATRSFFIIDDVPCVVDVYAIKKWCVASFGITVFKDFDRSWHRVKAIEELLDRAGKFELTHVSTNVSSVAYHVGTLQNNGSSCIVFYAASDRDESYRFATYLRDRFSRHDVVFIESALRIPSNAEAESK
jgi:hypothetical protein